MDVAVVVDVVLVVAVVVVVVVSSGDTEIGCLIREDANIGT